MSTPWHVLVLLAPALLAATACGGAEGGGSITTPTVPAGWERHTTADFEIDLPASWSAIIPGAENVDALVEGVRSVDPELGVEAERALTVHNMKLLAFDTETTEDSTRLGILRQESVVPTTAGLYLAGIEDTYLEQGVRVLSRDDTLDIGGFDAGSVKVSMKLGSRDAIGIGFVVVPDPYVVFVVTFTTSSARFDSLEPVFRDVAESFRVLPPS